MCQYNYRVIYFILSTNFYVCMQTIHSTPQVVLQQRLVPTSKSSANVLVRAGQPCTVGLDLCDARQPVQLGRCCCCWQWSSWWQRYLRIIHMTHHRHHRRRQCWDREAERGRYLQRCTGSTIAPTPIDFCSRCSRARLTTSRPSTTMLQLNPLCRRAR